MIEPGRLPIRSRTPRQERSQLRMTAVLAAADIYVAKHGPEHASIPEIAEAAGVPRASIYQFYPDKYALLSHVAERHLDALINMMAGQAQSLRGTDQPVATRVLIDIAADYFNSHEAAASLLLGGPFSRAAYLGRRTQISRLGPLLRAIVAGANPSIQLPEQPDVANIAGEIGLACMRFGYYQEGRVSDAIREQASIGVHAYLQVWAGPASAEMLQIPLAREIGKDRESASP